MVALTAGRSADSTLCAEHRRRRASGASQSRQGGRWLRLVWLSRRADTAVWVPDGRWRGCLKPVVLPRLFDRPPRAAPESAEVVERRCSDHGLQRPGCAYRPLPVCPLISAAAVALCVSPCLPGMHGATRENTACGPLGDERPDCWACGLHEAAQAPTRRCRAKEASPPARLPARTPAGETQLAQRERAASPPCAGRAPAIAMRTAWPHTARATWHATATIAKGKSDRVSCDPELNDDGMPVLMPRGLRQSEAAAW